MEKVVFVLVVLGFLYALYSLIGMVIKVKKAGKGKCYFQMSISRMIFRGVGILLVTGAAIVYKNMGNPGWLPFLCLAVINIVDFFTESIEIKEK